MTQSMFDDPSLFANLKNDAQQFVEDANSRGGSGVPLFYLDDGSYWIRLYPEVVERNGKKKLVVIRTIKTHPSLDKGIPRKSCAGPNCPACTVVSRLDEANIKDSWKSKSKDEAIIKAYVYKSSVSNEYVKTEVPCFIVLRWRAIVAVQNFIADLDPADLMKVLDPTKKAMMLKLTIATGNQSNCSIGFDIKEAELPALPDDFPSIYDAFIKDDDYYNDEQLNNLKKYVSEKIAMRTNVFNPETSKPSDPPSNPSSIPSTASANSQNTAAAILGNTAQPPAPTATPEASTPSSTPVAANAPTCGGASEGLTFGSHPDTTGAACIVCIHERACIHATKAKQQ